VIGARTWINVNHRDLGTVAVSIGDNTFIGQDNFLTSGKLIQFGPYCLTGAHCSFIGSTHVADDPMRPYITTGTSSDSSIVVGCNCFFGYGAMVLGQVHIGHGSIVGAGAVVRADVPPFSLVAGNPAKPVRHFDFLAGLWVIGPRPAEETAMPPTEEEYIRLLRRSHPHLVQPISAASAWLGDI
jgi:acetyltransferase-like isoleucine patch superfamily enzyme